MEQFSYDFNHLLRSPYCNLEGLIHLADDGPQDKLGLGPDQVTENEELSEEVRAVIVAELKRIHQVSEQLIKKYEQKP